MPARAASLRVTEEFRTRMVAIRKQAQQLARQTWAEATVENLNGYQPAILAIQVGELQPAPQGWGLPTSLPLSLASLVRR
jgi:hypothetical protein